MAQGTASERVSAYVCPPEHKHGLVATCAKIHRCRCQDCRDADAARNRHRRRMRGYGIEYRRPALGVHRRLEALATMGWSMPRIAVEAGYSSSSAFNWTRRTWVRPETHERVAAVYDRLWDKRPPLETFNDRVSYGRMIALSRRRGYVPPMGWDDIDRDPEPPAETTELAYVDHVALEMCLARELNPEVLTRRERTVLTELALERGWTWSRVERELGLSPSRAAERVRARSA